MAEMTLAEPASILHNLAMHQRDLRSWTAKADEAQFDPKTKCFPKARHLFFFRCFIGHADILVRVCYVKTKKADIAARFLLSMRLEIKRDRGNCRLRF